VVADWEAAEDVREEALAEKLPEERGRLSRETATAVIKLDAGGATKSAVANVVSKTMIDSEKYVLDPILEDQIAEIEEQIGQEIPNELRDVVSQVGFLQNAIGGDWPQSAREFIEMQEWIPEGHVAFMGDGAGNYYVVSTDSQLLFWDHETGGLTECSGDFKSFINGILLDPDPLDEVSWHVQLSFDVNEDQVIIELLVDGFGLHLLGGWEFKDTSPAGVSEYLMRFEENGKLGVISKLSYAGWDHDIVSFNRVIPIANISQHREMFQDFESDASLRFKLVNYGIMPTDLGDDG
jgi:hypothetical protein